MNKPPQTHLFFLTTRRSPNSIFRWVRKSIEWALRQQFTLWRLENMSSYQREKSTITPQPIKEDNHLYIFDYAQESVYFGLLLQKIIARERPLLLLIQDRYRKYGAVLELAAYPWVQVRYYHDRTDFCLHIQGWVRIFALGLHQRVDLTMPKQLFDQLSEQAHQQALPLSRIIHNIMYRLIDEPPKM
ncbi:hypothetical protein H6776_00530 [Candidatus Nomurabacteria bacterium]|nr:hypothetical protein [Candidatus Nomurabacteria bacterium]